MNSNMDNVFYSKFKNFINMSSNAVKHNYHKEYKYKQSTVCQYWLWLLNAESALTDPLYAA